MDKGDLYLLLFFSEMITAVVVFILLMFFTAPYGKHSRKGWGPMMGSRSAWVLMELPAVFVIVIVLVVFGKGVDFVNLTFLFLWELHYLYRTFLFPVFMRGSRRSFPVILVIFALLFNCLNGTLNGIFLGFGRDMEWMYSIPFIVGTSVFFSGFALHVMSDSIIRSLRKRGESRYRIPVKGPFRLVSNPNYLGEIIQWWGWALLTFSLAGVAFAVFTTANLLPRAISNHEWYRNHFRDYPEGRRILIPYIF
ncbi:MAG TPA: DUF1295 domain-containing protein [Euryarchaeota archaeon]|nr:DUF1295 domain-containing protein [Euryarchaeota archaeon]